MEWYNPPRQWQGDAQALRVTADGQTDFWRVTRHQYIKDDGHFFYQTISGDFEATVKVTGRYAALYDQAGLMLRENERIWLKAGIEYLNGVQQASAVITREFSDWSVVPLNENPAAIWIRILRIGSAVEVSFSLDGDAFVMIREGYLSAVPTLQIGLMCAAPRGEGFDTQFEDLKIIAKG